MAGISISPQIVKLNVNNYGTWRQDIKFVLNERNLWSIVIESELSPTLEEIEKDEGLKLVKQDFDNRARLALTCIYLNVDPEYRSIIENAVSPVEAWKLLKSYFQPDSKSRHMSLFSELISCYVNPSEKVGLYSARLNKIAESLKDIGHPVPEMYMNFQLLRYLPNKFDGIVQSILRWPDEKFQFKDITLELVAEETRLELRSSDREKRYDNIEIQNTTSPGYSLGKYRDVTCYGCGRRGHLRRNCRVRSSYGRPQLPSPSFEPPTTPNHGRGGKTGGKRHRK